MAKTLGIISAGLLLLTFGKFIWRRVPILKSKKRGLKWLVAVHPYAAGGLVIVGVVHGIRAYGYNFLFTGHVLMVMIVVDVLLGSMLSKNLTRSKVMLHRRLSYAVVGMLLLHNLYKFIL